MVPEGIEIWIDFEHLALEVKKRLRELELPSRSWRKLQNKHIGHIGSHFLTCVRATASFSSPLIICRASRSFPESLRYAATYVFRIFSRSRKLSQNGIETFQQATRTLAVTALFSSSDSWLSVFFRPCIALAMVQFFTLNLVMSDICSLFWFHT